MFAKVSIPEVWLNDYKNMNWLTEISHLWAYIIFTLNVLSYMILCFWYCWGIAILGEKICKSETIKHIYNKSKRRSVVLRTVPTAFNSVKQLRWERISKRHYVEALHLLCAPASNSPISVDQFSTWNIMNFLDQPSARQPGPGFVSVWYKASVWGWPGTSLVISARFHCDWCPVPSH